VRDLVASFQAPSSTVLESDTLHRFDLSSFGDNGMRALVLSIVLLVGFQKPNEIANSTDSEVAMESITKSTDSEIVPKEITNCIGMKLVLIPAGTFTMGSPMEEVGRIFNETPHEVTLTKSYFLGVYEVAQDQYEKVMGINPSNFKGAKNPVEMVSWDDAVSFCKKLSDMPEEKAARRSYRLPTEAEWEYACRAGSTTAFSSGDTAESLGEYAWVGESANNGKPHPVGEKKPNRLGLYDMHGNVWEWCQDWYDVFYPPRAATDPQGPNGGKYRVVRGGCFFLDAANCRAAVHFSFLPTTRTFNCGFRVALSPSVRSLEADNVKK
jgi:formylglycine-generating enzyme required for sulfatase activity